MADQDGKRGSSEAMPKVKKPTELEQLRTMRAKVQRLSLAMRAAWKYDEKDHVSGKWFRQLHAILNPSDKV